MTYKRIKIYSSSWIYDRAFVQKYSQENGLEKEMSFDRKPNQTNEKKSYGKKN